MARTRSAEVRRTELHGDLDQRSPRADGDVGPTFEPRPTAATLSLEGVEATVIGQFVPTGNLRLLYDGNEVGVLSMEFLHGGRPPVVRSATYAPPAKVDAPVPALDQAGCEDALKKILGSLNVASKHWIIRQYDHEVQSGSAIKPLVGPSCSGPGDAAVVRPRLTSRRGVVISCGMNPNFGDYYPYHMAASAIDEAVRNAVAVGADPKRLAILDNFCWGNTDRPETLGTLVRAALACHDVAVAGKHLSSAARTASIMNSLGRRQRCQTIDCDPFLVAHQRDGTSRRCRQLRNDGSKASRQFDLSGGTTYREFGGSHLFQVLGQAGGLVPQVRLETA